MHVRVSVCVCVCARVGKRHKIDCGWSSLRECLSSSSNKPAVLIWLVRTCLRERKKERERDRQRERERERGERERERRQFDPVLPAALSCKVELPAVLALPLMATVGHTPSLLVKRC